MIDDYYVITTEPVEEPITLAETKNWLRVNTDDDDALITSLITTARKFGEKYCNRIFVNTEIEAYFSGLDNSNCEYYPFIQIRRAPLNAISALNISVLGVYEEFTDYDVKYSGGFSRLIFFNGIGSADYDIPYPIKASITAGYGAASAVPDDIKTALKSHVAFLYENRGDVMAEGKLHTPFETIAIYSGKYRILNTFG